MRPFAFRNTHNDVGRPMNSEDHGTERVALDYARPQPAKRARGRALNKRGWIAIHAGYSIAILAVVFIVCFDGKVSDETLDMIDGRSDRRVVRHWVVRHRHRSHRECRIACGVTDAGERVKRRPE